MGGQQIHRTLRSVLDDGLVCLSLFSRDMIASADAHAAEVAIRSYDRLDH